MGASLRPAGMLNILLITHVEEGRGREGRGWDAVGWLRQQMVFHRAEEALTCGTLTTSVTAERSAGG